MAEGDGFTWAIIGAFVGGTWFLSGLRTWNLKRRIENTPTSAIRSLAMGLVEIQGTVKEHTKLLNGPLTGKPCVYYKYEIQEYRQKGKHSEWVTIKSGEQKTLFCVKDKTGQVLVDPNKAEIEIPADIDKQTGIFKDLPQSIKKYCTKHIETKGWFGIRKTLRFIERHLAPDDKIFIIGTAGDNPHKEEATAQHSVEDVMIQAKRGNPFYISDTHEKDVLSSMTRKVYGGLIGGGALFLFCLGIILAYLGAF